MLFARALSLTPHINSHVISATIYERQLVRIGRQKHHIGSAAFALCPRDHTKIVVESKLRPAMRCKPSYFRSVERTANVQHQAWELVKNLLDPVGLPLTREAEPIMM